MATEREKLIEAMARGYVEYNRKLHEEAARVEDYENYEWAELIALMSAALTALEATHVVVPKPVGNGSDLAVFKNEARASVIARSARKTLSDYGHSSACSSLPELIAADAERALHARDTMIGATHD